MNEFNPERLNGKNAQSISGVGVGLRSPHINEILTGLPAIPWFELLADNPVCIASPADALLHELLHAHSMLVKSEEFIAQGGMNNVLYPYKHEYAVIDAERKLYSNMSTQDKIKRPQRREHSGRTVKTHCPTCIK